MSLPDVVRSRPLLAIFTLALLMGLAFQGSRGLWDPDEGRYTNVALQMLRTGDAITLYRHHDSYHFTKPPLTYWAMAASMTALGRNEWAARLPMALAFVLSTVLIFQLGKTFVPNRPWLPAFIYLSAPFPFLAANTINTDTVLAAMETLAVLCYVQARFANKSLYWLDAMWAAFGLAVLTKGPPALLPLLAIVSFQFLHRGGPRLWRPAGSLAFALIGFSWFALVIYRHPGLLDYFLGHEVMARVASAKLNRHPQWYGPFLIYLPTLVLGLLPWMPLALGVMAVKKLRRLRGKSTENGIAEPLPSRWPNAQMLVRFLWLWLALPLVVFCLARSRLPLYILPLFAPLCLLIARPLSTLRLNRKRSLLLCSLLGFWLLLLIGIKGFLAQNISGESEIAQGLRRNSSRNLAEQIRPLLPGPAQEIIFIEDKTRYGLHFYLGAEVEKVSFRSWPKAISDSDFDKTLAESLDDAHGGRIYFLKRTNDGYFLSQIQASGKQAILLGVLADPNGRREQDRMVYTLHGDFPER